MTTILVIIGTISHNELKYNHLKNQSLFVKILLGFWNLFQILNILKKS